MRFNYTGPNSTLRHVYICTYLHDIVCGRRERETPGRVWGRRGQETHATSSPKSRIFLWQVSSRERREEEALLELPALVPVPPWCTGVGGAETVVAEDAIAAAAAAEGTDAEAEGSRRTVTAPRAGERSIVLVAVVLAVAIVVLEDDLLGAPPSCPRTRSRTLGRHQILFACHRTMVSTGWLFPGIPLETDDDDYARQRNLAEMNARIPERVK